MTRDEIRKEMNATLNQKGWSASDLSRQSKVSQAAIRGFLNGEEVSPQVLYRLCKSLGLDKRS